jgi:translation initiation factor 4G
MMEQISPKIKDHKIKNVEGKAIVGGQLFRKFLLNRCQEGFECGWVSMATATTTRATKDQVAKTAKEKNKDGNSGDKFVPYRDEYYAGQTARRQNLGLIKFIGELFKMRMLTERIMHECVQKPLGSAENPKEEEIEKLCMALTTVGAILDTNKARVHMDVYFAHMKDLINNKNVSSSMQMLLQVHVLLWISFVFGAHTYINLVGRY